MMVGIRNVGKVLSEGKPYLFMVGLQFGLAGAFIFIMDCLNHGMNRYIFIVYRNAFAALALAPFALFFERKIRPKMTLSVFFQIMALAFLEPVVDQGISFLGMQYTWAAYASTIMNAVPSLTFVLAAILRVERVNIKEVGSQAKVIGTVVTFGGVLFMTLYKGPLVHLFSSPRLSLPTHPSHASPTPKHCLIGTLLLLLGCLAWSSFYILQSITVKRYPAELSLACLICFLGALQTAVVALVADHHPRAWALGWDYRLFAPLYTGVVCSGIAYYVQGWVMQRRGPVFVTAFNPLCMIIVAVLGSLLLAEHLHLGSVIGGIIIAVGVYCVVWGKGKDYSHLITSSSSSATTTTTILETQHLPITSSPSQFSKLDTHTHSDSPHAPHK